jgi:hypothetical protein
MFVKKLQDFYDTLSDVDKSRMRWAAVNNARCPESFLLDIIEEILDSNKNKEHYISVAINNFKGSKDINKEFKRLNKDVIENMKHDFENLDGTFLEDNLNYVARNYKIFYTY